MLVALKLLFWLSIFSYLVSAYIAGGATTPHHVDSGAAAAAGRCQGCSTTSAGAALQSSRKEVRQRDGSAVGYSGAVTSRGAAALLEAYPPTSVDNLRRVYGQRRHWWGDLTAHETRRFYHELLPVSLEFECDQTLTLEERARLASMARHAARLYVRERCALPSRLVAQCYDGFRHLQKYGTWSWTGMTWEEVWSKYERQVRAEAPGADDDEVRDLVSRRILEKSCCTNEMFDRLAGVASGEANRKREAALRAVKVLAKRQLTKAKRGITHAPLLREAWTRPLLQLPRAARAA